MGGGGGFKNQRTSFRSKYSRIRCLFHFLIQVRNFFSPLMKLAPPSVLTNTGLPLLPMMRFVYKGICIKRVRDFDVDGSDRQTRENATIPLHLTSSLLLHKWAKEVDPNMTERRLSACNTFLRKICHLLTTHMSWSPSAADTIGEKFTYH